MVRRIGGQVPFTQAWKWLTKGLRPFAQNCRFVDEKLPQLAESGGEFH
jgi:hypothetical protein